MRGEKRNFPKKLSFNNLPKTTSYFLSPKMLLSCQQLLVFNGHWLVWADYCSYLCYPQIKIAARGLFILIVFNVLGDLSINCWYLSSSRYGKTCLEGYLLRATSHMIANWWKRNMHTKIDYNFVNKSLYLWSYSLHLFNASFYSRPLSSNFNFLRPCYS